MVELLQMALVYSMNLYDLLVQCSLVFLLLWAYITNQTCCQHAENTGTLLDVGLGLGDGGVGDDHRVGPVQREAQHV